MNAKQRFGLVLCLGALWLAGCGTSVKDIQEDKERYLARSSVTVEGEVTKGFRVPGLKPAMFEINDGTGKMPVLNLKGEMPEKGQKAKVTGYLKENYQFARQSFALVLIQE
ncbi:MAG: hypothetical protein V2A74_09930 [bacterium]